ncbi:MAG TPA: hypothetical protein VG497_34150, partial [Kribbella sp.]|nr:hypothetical protein [Kribbella sp.]
MRAVLSRRTRVTLAATTAALAAAVGGMSLTAAADTEATTPPANATSALAAAGNPFARLTSGADAGGVGPVVVTGNGVLR